MQSGSSLLSPSLPLPPPPLTPSYPSSPHPQKPKPPTNEPKKSSYAASLILTLTYGTRTPTPASDPRVREVNDCLRRLGETILPGAWLVDTYPVLRFVPGYLGRLRRWHLIELGLFRREMEGVRREVVRASFLLPHSLSPSLTLHKSS
jgi:hypothetical protein